MKFNKVPSIGRVTGDAYMLQGKNGKEYRVVPVTLLNGWKCHAFCNYVPEIDSLVFVCGTARSDTRISYTLYAPGEKVIEFVKRAYDDVQK